MTAKRQTSHWILDAVLFGGFLFCFALDLTGLQLHQWLGVLGGLLAFYHLILHWDWVAAVTQRLFGKTSAQSRGYYLLDGLLLAGLYVILITGLAMSTWLNLGLVNYAAWFEVHETVSLLTLGLLVLKLGLHWRWIVRGARQLFPRSAPVPAAPRRTPVPVPVTNAGMTRRDFLKLMGVVGAASLAAFTFTLNGSGETTAVPQLASKETGGVVAAQATTVPTQAAAATQTATAASLPVSQPVAASCTVRCDRRCSYPGHCNRYQDANGNNLCDLGECL